MAFDRSLWITRTRTWCRGAVRRIGRRRPPRALATSSSWSGTIDGSGSRISNVSVAAARRCGAVVGSFEVVPVVNRSSSAGNASSVLARSPCTASM